MFLQSILVYSSLIITMFLFALSASRKGSYYTTNNGIITERSFWRFDTIAPLVLFAIVFGMRYDVGVDHLGYIEGYLWREYVGKNEPLFFLFSDIGWYFNLHFTVYFAILAFVQVFFFFYAFKHERYIYPLLIFFIFINGDVFFWMNGIRQAMAMCVWIYSINFIHKRKLTPYIILGVISVLIHKSAIILFVFYPILRNGKDYFKSISLQLVLFASVLVVKEFFFSFIMRFDVVINLYITLLGAESYQQSYSMDGLMDSFVESSGTGLAYLFRIGVNLIIIFYSTKLKQFYNNKWFNIMYFFFFIGLITSYIFPVGVIAFIRPFQYFYIFQTIMYAYFGYYLFKNRSNGWKLILLILLLTCFGGILFLSQYNADNNSSLLYQFYFEHNINGYPK